MNSIIDCLSYKESDYKQLLDDINDNEILIRAVHPDSYLSISAYLKNESKKNLARGFFRTKNGFSVDKKCSRSCEIIIQKFKEESLKNKKELKYLLTIKAEFIKNNEYALAVFSKPLSYNLFHATIYKNKDNYTDSITPAGSKYLFSKSEIIDVDNYIKELENEIK